MARKTFFSFHYEQDAWRAANVRNSGVLSDDDEYGFIDAADWEKIEREGDAVQAIESVMAEVRTHIKRAQIDKPDIDPADLAAATGKPQRHGIGQRNREEVRFLILSGVAHAEVVRRSGVSSGTVSAIRQALKAEIPLFRNTEMEICVPTACPPPDFEGDAESHPIEKIGGPGRTRTCDNTVMSGAF